MTRQEFDKLIETHYRKNFATLTKSMSTTGSNPNAEDIVQEAYMRAIRFWKTYDPSQPFENWFATILRNSISDFFRTEIMHGMVKSEDYWDMDFAIPESFKRIQLQELLKIIDDKDENVKRILTMYLIEGYKSHEIEQVVPESASNIRKIVERFRDEISTVR